MSHYSEHEIGEEFGKLERITARFSSALVLVRELRTTKAASGLTKRCRLLLGAALKQATEDLEMAAQSYLQAVVELDELLGIEPRDDRDLPPDLTN